MKPNAALIAIVPLFLELKDIADEMRAGFLKETDEFEPTFFYLSEA